MWLLHLNVLTKQQVLNIIPFTPTNIQLIKDSILYFAL